MKASRKRTLPLVIVAAAALLACSSGGASPGVAGEPRVAAADPAPPSAGSGAGASVGTSAFAAVDTSRLSPEGKAFFSKMASEEVCPCDCPKTFGQCLQEGTRCGPAVLLAEWVIDQLEGGVPPEALEEAVARELSGGFTAPRRTPVTDGYAAKGAARPRVTIVEYADFECAHCRAAAPVLEQVAAKHPDVRVVFKHFPLTFHPMARKAAIATEAAGRQGRFWEMHDAVFATQEHLSDDLLLGHAKALRLDVARFEKDLADPALAKKVDASRNEGAALGITATPAFFVDGRPYFLSRSLEGFELRMRMDAARAGSSCQ